MLEFTVEGRARRAALWIPEQFDEARRWPLLVFLHAHDERGDDSEHLEVGITPALDAHPQLYPCLVLLPQCPRDMVWSKVARPWAEGQGSAAAHVAAAVRVACEELPVDRDRIALTGASMGGFGTFALGAELDIGFSALGPVCGGGDPARAAALADLPLWAIHGADDEVVPVAESRAMVEAIRQQGGRGPLRYTEIPDGQHDVWDQAYADPEFAGFLLRNHRHAGAPEPTA